MSGPGAGAVVVVGLLLLGIVVSGLAVRLSLRLSCRLSGLLARTARGLIGTHFSHGVGIVLGGGGGLRDRVGLGRVGGDPPALDRLTAPGDTTDELGREPARVAHALAHVAGRAGAPDTDALSRFGAHEGLLCPWGRVFSEENSDVHTHERVAQNGVIPWLLRCSLT
jgi:hypothetical protein